MTNTQLPSSKAPPEKAVDQRSGLRIDTPEGPSKATDDRLDELHADLVATFSPSIEDLDPVPRSTVEQARRFALLAAELMRQGAYDYEALAEGWNTTTATARKRVLRAVNRSELFTVSFGGLTFVPGFLLDEQLETRPELAPIVETLVGGGDRGFALWAWLTTPTAWLDGAVPHELATADRERVVRVAAQRASNAA